MPTLEFPCPSVRYSFRLFYFISGTILIDKKEKGNKKEKCSNSKKEIGLPKWPESLDASLPLWRWQIE